MPFSIDLTSPAGQRRLTHVGQLGRVHHFQAAVVGQLLHRFLGGVGRLLPLLGFAISVDNLLVAALGVVVAQRQHLAERVERLLYVVVVAIDRAQPLQKY